MFTILLFHSLFLFEFFDFLSPYVLLVHWMLFFNLTDACACHHFALMTKLTCVTEYLMSCADTFHAIVTGLVCDVTWSCSKGRDQVFRAVVRSWFRCRGAIKSFNVAYSCHITINCELKVNCQGYSTNMKLHHQIFFLTTLLYGITINLIGRVIQQIRNTSTYGFLKNFMQ